MNKLALVIDDEKIDRDTFSDLLKRVSFLVDLAEDGKEGVRKVKKSNYDIILLDIRMPGLDGEQVLRILNRLNESLPVLIVSDYLTKDKVMKLKKLGAKGFLAKPIDINNFYNAVNQICPINTVQK